ncbi:NACHT domain-containing protein [Streptomyces sp. NPDC088794]|uniref:NACHT domain-containing protein n=1 Tax=Streptomyces sp. NPDC088794 TaxID=3365902 RepID=UPI00382E9893
MEPEHLAALRSYAEAILEITTREKKEIIIPQIKSLRYGSAESSPEALLKEREVLLQGPPGSGKTYLVRYLAANCAEGYLNGKECSYPILIQANRVVPPNGREGTFWLADQAIEQAWGGDLGKEALRKVLKDGNSRVFLDGLDEILDTESRISILQALIACTRKNSRLSFTVSIRERHLEELPHQLLKTLSPWIILPFDEVRLLKLRAVQLSRFETLTQISESRLLKESMGNPLLLALLSTYFIGGLELPKSRGRLFEDITHAMYVRERERAQAMPPASEMERGLEVFAKALATKKIPHMSIDAAKIAIESDPEWNFNSAETERFLIYAMERLVMLVCPIEGRIGFTHRVFYEYYLGRVLARNIDLVNQIAFTDLDESLRIAAGLAANPISVITVAYVRRTLQLAVSCCEELENPEFARDYLVNLIAKDLRPEYLTALHKVLGETGFTASREGGNSQQSQRDENILDFYSELQELWVSLPRRGATANDRGNALEAFSEKLFGGFFHIVTTRHRHRVGEIDLVCENQNVDPFWSPYGGDVWIECKNTESKASIEQVNTFIGKLVGSRWKIGFFLSSSGFSRDAMRRISEAAANPSIPLIVPISGAEIQHVIAERLPLSRFFKECVRKVA